MHFGECDWRQSNGLGVLKVVTDDKSRDISISGNVIDDKSNVLRVSGILTDDNPPKEEAGTGWLHQRDGSQRSVTSLLLKGVIGPSLQGISRIGIPT